MAETEKEKRKNQLRNGHPYNRMDMHTSMTSIFIAKLQWNYKTNLSVKFSFLLSLEEATFPFVNMPHPH